VTHDDIDGGIPTLAAALSEHLTVGELTVLATLTHTRAPTRKAALVEHICQSLGAAGTPGRCRWVRLPIVAHATTNAATGSS
jgi:hypothetical protein